ncbi:Clp protease ClpP [Dechloromonas sp. TW-R-39-2]|uniref:ClpP-like prohead protease/major capsid protein fusion protein n=1 Tax=Dechloromonas sp. TW-R-39-2 TaxID=2654218 RepID=UPI00193C96CC|nr:ClpP-like prohead protease/major capsid protein fusion protein [Dechloromonas sp. TW-R-39-2]QRM19554.1 Clp protease ClpP [Dechloromonas sp. TW-R-39-2]
MSQSQKGWFSIRAPRAQAGQGSSAEVFIYGDIGESWYGETIAAKDFVKEIAALDVEQLTVRINSVGGSVPDGLAIYNALKRHKATVTTCIDGMAMSIASLIAMAGDTVEIADNALLMIHAPWTYAGGNSEQLRETADVLDTWASAMSTSYAAKTGRPQDEMLALLTDGVDHYYTAEEALKEGFVDAVVSALPISASAVVSAEAIARFRHPAAPEDTPAAAAATFQEKSMPHPNPAAPQPTAKTEDEIKAAVLAADQSRRVAIAASFGAFASHEGVNALMTQCQNDSGCDETAANAKLLAHLGSKSSPLAGHHVVTVADETDKLREAGVEAILARAGIRNSKGEKIRAHGSNPFRAHSLLDMARAALARAGIRTDGMDKMQIVASAFTQGTSDFPILLENAMHKTLQAAYATAPDTWSRFCSTGSVSDFRDHPRYRVGSLGNLDALNELGEFKNKSIPDGERAKIKAGTKGNIINISRQAIINDDLGAFIGLAQMLARAAKRTIEADVYALLALNSGLGPLLEDGQTLFHASHGNISATGAISSSVFDDVRVKFALQKNVGGNDFLDLRPSVLLVPTAAKGDAVVINGAEFDPDTANKLQKPNKVRGQYSDIVDTARLSGTRFYSFADAMDAPVIEVAFLDGNQDPYLEMEQGFTVDGARYKVRLDYGIGAIDYRGAVTSAGA